MRLSSALRAAAGPLEAAALRGDLAPITRHLSPAVAKLTDLVAASASGCRVTTADGRTLLDCAAGIGVTSTGHCHPAVTSAIAAQAATLINAQQNLFPGSVPLGRLLDRLTRIAPPHLDTFFFSNSGSEAIDQAVKIARAATGRPYVLSFDHGFHGRTLGALSLTHAKAVYREGFSPLVPSTASMRYPACLRCSTRRSAPDGDSWYGLAPRLGGEGFPAFADRKCCNEPLEALKWQLKQSVPASEVAAIVVEPILGEGGFLTPPPGFMDGLRALTTDIGALLVVDEVQSGAGRTGAWWGHSHVMQDTPGPDLMVFAKGIASGFPFAGVAARHGLHDRVAVGSMGGTYGGNPLACAAAAATIDVIEGEGLMANATARGRQLAAGLVDLAGKWPAIVDVRGRGLMLAVEFGDGRGGLDAAPGTASAVAKAAGGRGLMVMTAGAREALRFLPPLVISEAEVEEALAAFGGALEDVFGGGGGR